MKKTALRAGQKAVDPPLLLTDDPPWRMYPAESPVRRWVHPVDWTSRACKEAFAKADVSIPLSCAERFHALLDVCAKLVDQNEQETQADNKQRALYQRLIDEGACP